VDPLSSRAARRLGVARGKAGQRDEALAVLQKAIEREPQNALLWYEQGTVKTEAGDRIKSVVYFQKAVELKPDDADAQNNLGINLAQTGDTHGAERHSARVWWLGKAIGHKLIQFSEGSSTESQSAKYPRGLRDSARADAAPSRSRTGS
jgi:tetratricopeptide (TPR) repeat protein